MPIIEGRDVCGLKLMPGLNLVSFINLGPFAEVVIDTAPLDKFSRCAIAALGPRTPFAGPTRRRKSPVEALGRRLQWRRRWQ